MNAASPATTRNATANTLLHGVRIEPDASESWVTYSLGKRLGKGGMANVHEIFPETNPRLLAKLFNDDMRNRIKGDPKIAMRLAALVRHRAEIAESLNFATWPRRILFSKASPNGPAEIAATIVGFTMTRLTNTISLHELMMNEKRRLRLTRDHTAVIAIMMADQIARMHKHPWGFVFGDLSPNNIHVDVDFKAVTFIDTDSFQFSFDANKYSFTMGGITPGYSSPGINAQLKATGRATKAHDDYVLAILLFQLFMMEQGVPRHPLQTLKTPIQQLIEKRIFPYLDPAAYPLPQICIDAYAAFPQCFKDAFVRSFTTPHTVTSEEWTRILSEHRRSLRPR